MIYLGNGMYSDAGSYLQHFGILGQKWGKRNGPPYPLNDSKKSWSERRQEKKAAKKIVEDGYNYPGYSGKKLKSIDTIDRNDLINTQNGNFKKVTDDIMKNPEKLASAILGTKAILSSRYDNHTNITKGDIDWFLWEDQTIGLQPIAQLVQKGATKKQVIQFLDKEVKAYDNGMDDGISFGAVESWVGSYSKKDTEKFIDECIKIRDSGPKKKEVTHD